VRKTRPARKRAAPLRKGKLKVDATRLALAALERIKGALRRKGHGDQLGAPVTMRELAARASYLGVSLPPSYTATVRAASRIGGPERLLSAAEMRAAFDDVISPRASRPDAERLAPFAKLGERSFACFDRAESSDTGELGVAEWVEGAIRGGASHFGEWLDAALASAVTFSDEGTWRTLWRESAAKARAGEIAPADAGRIQELIKVRRADLHAEATALDPEDSWALKVGDLTGEPEAADALGELEGLRQAGTVDPARAARVRAAILARFPGVAA